MLRRCVAVFGVLCVFAVASAAGELSPAELIDQDWLPQAPPLPAPEGQVLRAETVRQIFDAVANLEPGGTVLVADGRYEMPRSLHLRTDGATLRGESGDRSKVVLDFAESRHGEGVCISYATGVTVADLTVANVYWNAIKINSDHDVHRATIYNVVSRNAWQRHVKGPGIPDKDGRPQYNQGSRIQYCLFYNDRPKRPGDDPYEDGNEGQRFGFNYIGGIDVMRASGWTISDNVFVGIRGRTREGRGAIFLWHHTRDSVVERNIIIDCDLGIALGNASGRGELRHAENMMVRNNFITRAPQGGIVAIHTRDCRIVHNTVHEPDSRLHRLVRAVFANDGLVLRNNLLSGPGIRIGADIGEVTVENNRVEPMTGYFVDPARGNLRLTPEAVNAIGRAAPTDEAETDIDGRPRGDTPDLGAHQLADN